MSGIAAAFDFIEQIEREDDPETIQGRFASLIAPYGFVSFAAADLVSPLSRFQDNEPLVVSRWPAAWQERWLSRQYVLNDPVVLTTLKSSEPFFWHDVRPRAKGLGARIMDEGGEFQLFDGLCVPLHRWGGPPAVVSLAGPKLGMGERERAAIELSATHFFTRLESLMRDPVTRPETILTDRERDVLQFVAAGKTDWEVSRIYCISEHTAISHVKHAIAKLNAANRTHAVSLAIRLGEIVP